MAWHVASSVRMAEITACDRPSVQMTLVIFLKAKMRHLNEIECFVKAVELKSLTAAAKAA
jgi:hypothetical protein